MCIGQISGGQGHSSLTGVITFCACGFSGWFLGGCAIALEWQSDAVCAGPSDRIASLQAPERPARAAPMSRPSTSGTKLDSLLIAAV